MESITIFKDNSVKVTTKYYDMSFDSIDDYLDYLQVMHQLSLKVREVTRKLIERKHLNK